MSRYAELQNYEYRPSIKFTCLRCHHPALFSRKENSTINNVVGIRAALLQREVSNPVVSKVLLFRSPSRNDLARSRSRSGGSSLPGTDGSRVVSGAAPRLTGGQGTSFHWQNSAGTSYCKNPAKGAAPKKGKCPERHSPAAIAGTSARGAMPKESKARLHGDTDNTVKIRESKAGADGGHSGLTTTEWPCITEDLTGPTPRLVGVRGTPSQWRDSANSSYCKNPAKGSAQTKGKCPMRSQPGTTTAGASAEGKRQTPRKTTVPAYPEVRQGTFGISSVSGSSPGAERPSITGNARGSSSPKLVGEQGTRFHWQEFANQNYCKNPANGSAPKRGKCPKRSDPDAITAGENITDTTRRKATAQQSPSNLHKTTSAGPGASSGCALTAGAEWPCITEDATGPTPRIVGVRGTPSQWHSSALVEASHHDPAQPVTGGRVRKAARCVLRLLRRLGIMNAGAESSGNSTDRVATEPGYKDPQMAAEKTTLSKRTKQFFRSFKCRPSKVSPQDTMNVI